ncbi:anti-anti-sigma factor [Actinoplanes lutulentus]|uniref:Anti-sigma factor antagonist n=1 Tax=Actinoplanes lutulentus TaxID=1287878 RepID=A0A327ZC91_9ACTN|nr:STAS domain-containing protein [Actinoplanes lutulentus]MBB2946827.1 anti-anti-sigma factor [Actinoplanes lutulentus]RAK35719.1 anti-anti-sigma factor [Actinoplanes lutulentus]
MSSVDLPDCCPRAEIELEVTGQTATSVTVAVRGEIDMDNGEHMRHTLLTMLSSTPETLVVDMGGVLFLGSVGLRVLVECHTVSQEQGRHLVLDNVRSWEQRVIEMAGLGELFDMRTSEQA